MTSRAARPLLLAALLLAAWAGTHAVAPELDAVWLSLVPVIGLVLLLVAGHYAGERTIARLAAARRPARPRPTAVVPRVRRVAAQRAGGLLLARRLAGRAPPRALLAA